MVNSISTISISGKIAMPNSDKAKGSPCILPRTDNRIFLLTNEAQSFANELFVPLYNAVRNHLEFFIASWWLNKFKAMIASGKTSASICFALPVNE